MDTRTSYANRRGFTLIEVLVTLVVFALGVLTTAILHGLAMKLSLGGQLRSQAIVLGVDLLERMEANNSAAIAGNYAACVLPVVSPVDCRTDFCQPADLATYDLVQFNSRLQAQLPGSSACVVYTAGTPVTYSVQINWVERISKGSTTTVNTSGTSNVGGSGKTETFSYTVQKLFYDSSTIL